MWNFLLSSSIGNFVVWVRDIFLNFFNGCFLGIISCNLFLYSLMLCKFGWCGGRKLMLIFRLLVSRCCLMLIFDSL